MSDLLLLGPVTFRRFEIPSCIGFGGRQQMAVHRLPGGARVIDAMGRDDAPIIWDGAFAGPDAADRARLLDLLRVEGLPLPLYWDAFAYLVVIAAFDAAYERPNWVPYRIACTVLLDETQALSTILAPLAVTVAADLGAASAVDTSAATAALGLPGATTLGTANYEGAVGAVGAALGQAASTMNSAGVALAGAADPVSAASAAGTLALAADANGYLSRAAANLANASS